MNPNAEHIRPEDCLLLMVDIQKPFLDTCINGDLLKKNAMALADTAKVFDIPILFTVQNMDRLGGFDPDILDCAHTPELYDKMEFSALENPEIKNAVASKNRRTLLLAGMETHICIFHTALSALHLGYRVHVASDAVSSPRMIDWKVGLKRLEKSGAVLSSTEMIIFELLGRAGTPQFKQLLPVLKNLAH